MTVTKGIRMITTTTSTMIPERISMPRAGMEASQDAEAMIQRTTPRPLAISP